GHTICTDRKPEFCNVVKSVAERRWMVKIAVALLRWPCFTIGQLHQRLQPPNTPTADTIAQTPTINPRCQPRSRYGSGNAFTPSAPRKPMTIGPRKAHPL